jgi:ribosome-binding factor A
MSQQRAIRAASIVREAIIEILRKEIQDASLSLLSITEVIMSPDLSKAKVYVSFFTGNNHEKKKSLFETLLGYTKRIRGELAGRLDFRIVPDLEFILDESLEKGDHILLKLRALEKEREKREQS